MDKIKETIKQLEEMKEHFKSVQEIDDCADHVGHIKAKACVKNVTANYLRAIKVVNKGCEIL